MARTTTREVGVPTMTGAPSGAPALIRWGAVFGGVVIGLSLLILMVALWTALAFGNGNQGIQENLAWYIGISGVAAMFIGGLTAGWLSGVPGAGPGFFNGLTVWGLILIASLAIGAPGAGLMGAQFDTFTFAQLDSELAALQGDPLWAGFVSLLIGALVASIGGMIGGLLTRPAFGYQLPAVMDERYEERREARTDHGRARGEEHHATEHAHDHGGTVAPHEHRADGRTIDLRSGDEVTTSRSDGDGNR